MQAVRTLAILCAMVVGGGAELIQDGGFGAVLKPVYTVDGRHGRIHDGLQVLWISPELQIWDEHRTRFSLS
jgi:hypothetical protein